jgi:Arc/MetJ family transcription regulator
MARVRVSTTVDEEMLAEARRLHGDSTDAAVLDEALRALLARHRAGQIDAAYEAYDDQPLDQADEWGDLASFRDAAAAT